MVEINDNGLKAWLKDKPREFPAVIASRTALRVLPMLVTAFHKEISDQNIAVSIKYIFRANLISWAKAKTPVNENKRDSHLSYDVAAAYAAAAIAPGSEHVTANYVRLTASYALHAASGENPDEAVGDAAASASVFTARAALKEDGVTFDVISATITADINRLAQGKMPYELARMPLWVDYIPDEIAKNWQGLKNSLNRLDEGWQVWIDWYADILVGRNRAGLPDDLAEELDLKIATQDDEWWQSDVATINKEIADWTLQALVEAGERGSDNDDEILLQLPAAFGFGIRDNKIFAYPQSGDEIDPDLLAQILPLLLEKAKAYNDAMRFHGNAPQSVRDNALKLVDAVESWAETPAPGVLLMRMRSLEADINAYDTKAGREELFPHAIAAMFDLKSSIEDFLGMDPFVQKIQANALALDIQAKNVDEINQRLDDLEEIAKKSVYVDSSVIKALAEGKSSNLSGGHGAISATSHKEKSDAIEANAKQSAHRVMSIRNFAASMLRAVQDGAIDGVEKSVAGTIKTGFALLVGAIVGPLAGIAVYVASLKPIAEKTKLVAKKQKPQDDEEETSE